MVRSRIPGQKAVIRLVGFIRWGIILGVLVLLAGTFLEYQRRGELYWYDVRDNYTYSFASGAAKRVPVEITSTGFTFPAIDDSWDTAVLPLQVESTRLGQWFEPYVEVRSGGAHTLQYFDRGAEGRRYLVFGRQLLKPGQAVTMTGVHLSWPDQGRELLLFSNPGATSGRVLVIAPHPDDAEIAAFGVYSENDAYVATVTAGDYVDDLYEHLEPNSADRRVLRGRARTWDSLVVPTWGGVPADRVVNLGYSNSSLTGLFDKRQDEDTSMSAEAQDPNRFRAGAIDEMLAGRRAQPTWDSLVADLRALVETVRPDAIIAPHPAMDAAPDHQLATVALLQALAESGEHKALLLLYTNHHVFAEYYPFGPSATAIALPPWFEAEPAFGGVFSYPLDAELRQSKLFALDDMHDLRAAPRMVMGQGPVERFFHRLTATVDNLRRNPLDTYSYYRRAVRENELFFVYRPEERSLITRSDSADFNYR